MLDSVYEALPGMHSLSGVEFEELDPEGKAAAVQSVKLLSRVEPSHKSELVSLLKAQVRAALPCPALPPCLDLYHVEMFIRCHID